MILAAGALSALLSGCLSATVPEVSYWNVDYKSGATSKRAAKHGIVRLSALHVRSPYDVREIPVLKADGAMAFDPYNKFPSIPSQLLKGAAFDAVADSGLFGSTVAAGSSVLSEVSMEVTVLKLALDCRNEGVRKAVVNVSVVLLNRDRQIVSIVSGSGESDAAAVDYSTAFSCAFSSAMAAALSAM